MASLGNGSSPESMLSKRGRENIMEPNDNFKDLLEVCGTLSLPKTYLCVLVEC